MIVLLRLCRQRAASLTAVLFYNAMAEGVTQYRGRTSSILPRVSAFCTALSQEHSQERTFYAGRKRDTQVNYCGRAPMCHTQTPAPPQVGATAAGPHHEYRHRT